MLKNMQLDIAELERQYCEKETIPFEGEEGEEPEGWEPEQAVTLETFDELMKGLQAEASEMQALDNTSCVGVMLVNIEQLKRSILPSPIERIQELQVCAVALEILRKNGVIHDAPFP